MIVTPDQKSGFASVRALLFGTTSDNSSFDSSENSVSKITLQEDTTDDCGAKGEVIVRFVAQ